MAKPVKRQTVRVRQVRGVHSEGMRTPCFGKNPKQSAVSGSFCGLLLRSFFQSKTGRHGGCSNILLVKRTGLVLVKGGRQFEAPRFFREGRHFPGFPQSGKAKNLMKAILLKEYGLPNVLEIGEVAKPIPNDNEVLVRIHSASINDWDWGLVRGKPFVIRLFFGLKKPKINIPGVDVSGKIEAVGSKVSSFKIGDEIYCDLSECGCGGFAEYVCVPEKILSKKPSNISHNDASALPHAGLLALQGLVEKGKVKSGQSILINGAGGGVGTLGIQILKSYGQR
jgi:hypothetical protein